jgi:hypothetical protein
MANDLTTTMQKFNDKVAEVSQTVGPLLADVPPDKLFPKPLPYGAYPINIQHCNFYRWLVAELIAANAHAVPTTREAAIRLIPAFEAAKAKFTAPSGLESVSAQLDNISKLASGFFCWLKFPRRQSLPINQSRLNPIHFREQ